MATRALFGTDGIRGRANEEPMTASTVLAVAMAAAREFRRGTHRHRVVIGKDTRLSGYMLEPALTAGFVAEGMDVILLAPLPTPAVAMLTRSLRADLGVMISASHNPYQDNGIKLFGPDGYKLSDAVEARIEARIQDIGAAPEAGPDGLGRASRLGDAVGRYVEYVKATSPGGLRLDGLKVVLDCAHGAAYKVGPAILWELGAEVTTIGTQPDGRNINAGCGATHPEALCEAVKAQGAHAGLALDGDADRLIMVDEQGHVIDGDQLIALIAASWNKAGRLASGRVVTTVMSNLGFERFLDSEGIGLTRTPVGDRYVVEAMRASGANVGGEQSGHIILGDYSTTGDAMIAALQVLAILKDRAEPASQVCRVFKPLPQILVNVRAPGEVLALPSVKDAVAVAEGRLNGHGRLLIRKSGTEPLIRVMAEGEDEALVQGLVNDLSETIRTAAI